MTGGITGGMIDHQELCTLIPHAGSMCLLDAVESWDAQQIVCLAVSHRDPANPLRSEGGLKAIHGIEYAAQAMAVHGGLCARARGEHSSGGFLAALRDVVLHVPRLDQLAAPLRVAASEQMRAGGSFIYDFSVSDADGQALLSGRATVMAQEEG